MNLEPSYPQIMQVNRRLYQDSIDLIWGASEKQVDAKLDKDGLHILSKVNKASSTDQHLPYLRSGLRYVKCMRLDAWDQDHEAWPSRVLANVFAAALLDNKCLVKMFITFWFPDVLSEENPIISSRAERTVRRLLRPL